MRKIIVKHLLLGVAFECIAFVANAVLYYLSGFYLIPYILERPTANAISLIVIGIGFFGGGMVYEIERLSFVLKLVIHLAVGIGIFLIVAFSIGWLSTDNPVNVMFNIFFNASILFIFWVVCYIRDKNEVQNINKMIARKNANIPLDTE